MENDLKKMGIDIDDPNFTIADYDVPNPRPPKNRAAGMPHQMGGPPSMPPMAEMPGPMVARY